MTAPVVLENAMLRALVTPDLGGTIASLRHLASGAEVLARTPWETSTAPLPFAPDEATWLTRFVGGWPVMFPNAGDACDDGRVRHGFHGEGSFAPWEATQKGQSVILTRRFAAVPVTMTRQITLVENRLEVAETVTADAPCQVVWGQHVTLGSDLLAGPVTLQTSAQRVASCASYDPPANPLIAGSVGDWPILPGRRGPVDLSHPPAQAALLACLASLGPAPWASLTRADGLGVRLDWTADPWPLAWLWMETGGTQDAPWHGKGRMIGIEPCTTWPATGLVAARAAGGNILSLAAGKTRHAAITLTILNPAS